MNKDEQAAIQADIIESMERSAEVYGLSRSAGRVYGVLYFADSPLPIPDLVDETGYAKSTISTVTRKLARIGLIRRRSSSSGGRQVTFEPVTDLWFVIQDVFRQYLHREMSLTQRTLTDALERLDELDEQEVSADRERIEELQATYDDLQALLDVAMNHRPQELIEATDHDE